MGFKQNKLPGNLNRSRAGICFEPLEPRLLLSGTWGVGVDGPASEDQTTGEDRFRQDTAVATLETESSPTTADAGAVDLLGDAPALSLFGSAVPEADTAQSDDPAAVMTPATESPSDDADIRPTRELILINDNVTDYEQLVADIQDSNGDRILDVAILDSSRDGIEQVSEILSGRADLSAVHVITHGAEGRIGLGSSWLDADSLEANQIVVSGWGESLTESGDMLFYGCNVAENSEGQSLLSSLSALTGADVAGSTDETGHTLLGGDWDLEHVTGSLETDVAIQPELQSQWIHLLASPTELSSGIELNADGGNDAYLISDTGLSQSLTETTVEIRFAANDTPYEPVFISFNNPTDDELSIQIDEPSKNLELDFGAGTTAYASAIDYRAALVDGSIHTLSVTWDNTAGDWAVYIDGAFIESGTGLSATTSLDTTNGRFVFGQEQDGPDSGYDSSQYFSGTLYDVRIWNEVRTAEEIALDHQHKYDSGSLPSGLIANWQMDGFNGSDEVVDVVGGNNLSIGHATGTGFSTSTPVGDLNIDENSANGATVGFVVPTDPDVHNDIVSDGLFLEAGIPASPTTYSATQSFGGWTVDSGSIQLLGDWFADSPNGGGSIDMNGSSTGAISQTLTTEIGKEYQVTFAVTGMWAFDTNTKDIRVSAAGTSQDFSVDYNAAWDKDANPLWEHRSFSFVATSTTTTLTFTSLEAGNAGVVLADVQVAEIPAAVSTILANDSTLTYDAATSKFYRHVTTTATWIDAAYTHAPNATINGVSGQLARIDSAYENEIIHNFVLSSGNVVYVGGTDATVEDEWRWLDGTADGDQFASGSTAQAGYYANFASGQPNGGTSQNGLFVDTLGTWQDGIATQAREYVIEWDASEVLSSYTFSLTDDAGGRFGIDGSTGEITVADGTLLDYETNTSHTVTVQVTDAGGNSYSEAMAIAVNDVDEVILSNSVPGAQATDEDTTLTFSSGNGNRISVYEDAGSTLTVVLTVSNGTLTASGAGSATVSGDGTAALTITGLVADINLALDGLQYDPTAETNGADTLTMTTTDGEVYALNIDADLLGFYAFDSSDPAGDSSPGGLYDGTLTGDAISVVTDGERGDVLSLGGDQDFLNVGSVMGSPTDVTLAAWVKFSSADTNGGEVITLGNDVALRVDDPGQGGVTAFFWDGSSHQYINSGVSLADGTWHHVAFSFDDTANTQTLYIDGVVAGSATATASISYTGWFPNTRIGAHANDADVDFDFNGLIDDARICSRALSAAEITALAGAPAQQTDTDTVAITVNPVNDAPTFWDYHHDIDIDSATAIADYPIKIQLTEGVSGFSHANAQANGGDLRFYDAAGNELDYWVEEWNPAGTSTVWVQIATAGTTSIDLYYGNADVVAASDPDATFLYYDDFADGTAGTMPVGWTAVGGATSGTQPSVVDDGGDLVFSDGTNSGGPVVSTGSWSDVAVSHDFRTINPGDPIDHAGLIARYTDANNMVYGGIVDANTAEIWYKTSATAPSFIQIGGSWDISALNVDDGNWHNQELRVYGDTAELYIDDTLVGSASLASTGAPASGQTGYWSQYSNYEAYRENHIVRSYDGGTGDISSTRSGEGFSVDENSANGTIVGSVIATDPEGDPLSYSITAGNTDSAFTIDNSGLITVNNSAALDFETNPTFTLTVQVDDGNGGIDTDTVTIALNGVNDAPELIGANDLMAIDEDDFTSGGTLVSALISGQVVDADSGSVEGIAVIAVDDTNGTWQYTTDGGTNWYAFGVVDNATARLLAADANTSVRFVPDADWNGTVNDGIAFHAWDQTTGSAGGTADLTSTYTVRDDFTTVAYTNNNGTFSWTGSWNESGDDGSASTGNLRIEGGELYLHGAVCASRTFDLSSAVSATLTFDYSGYAYSGTDNFAFSVSDDGGATWIQLEEISFVNSTGDYFNGNRSFDLGSLVGLTGNMVLRLEVTSGFAGPDQHVNFDNVQVAYTTSNGTGGTTAFSTATASSSITVNPVDDPVTIGGDISGSGDEDAGDIIGTLTATDAADGLTDGTYFTVTTDGTNGSASIDPASGAWTYTPDADFNGSDTFTVTITDDDGHTATQVISITVNQIDDAGTFGGDTSGSGDEDGGAITGTLTFADTADGASTPNFTVTGAAGNGTAAIDAGTGDWSYTPNADFNGSDNFTVTVTDDDGNTETQVISITVNPVDDPVTIGGDISGSGDEDAGDITGTLTATDAADGLTDGTYFTVTTDGTNGSASIDPASGAWTYTPDADFNGSDTFTVTITDDDGHTDTQVISITVNPVDDPVTIGGDTSGSGGEDAGDITGTLTATDAADGLTDGSYFTVTTDGTNGSASINAASGAWTYTPDADFNGSDSFTVTITDDDGHTATQMISITVNTVNDAPTVANAIPDQVASEAVAFSFTFAANTFTDVDVSDTLTYTVTLDDNSALPAWLNFDVATRTFSGTPAGADVGTISVKVTADDGTATVFDIFDITVNANNPPTIGGTETGAVTEDVAVVANHISTSSALTIADPDTGQSSFVAETVTGTYGDLAIDAAGNWSYAADNTQAAIQQLDAGQSVTDTLTVTTADGTTHDVIITINGTEDAPTLGGDIAGLVTEDGTTTATGALAASDGDTNDNPMTYTVVANQPGSNGYGDFSIDAAGNWDYDLNNAHAAVQSLDAGEALTDSYAFTVTDANGDSTTQTVTVTINGAEDAAVIGGTFTGTVTEDGPLTDSGTLAITDADTSDNPVSFADQGATAGDNGYGSFALASGTWTYTLTNAAVQSLDAGQSVTDAITYTATDGSNQTVTVTIDGVEDTPVIGGTNTGAVTEDGTLTDAAALTVSDADAGESSFVAETVAGTHGSLTIDAAGNWSYAVNNTQAAVQQLDAGESISDTLTVTTADGTTHTVTITINGAEDAPAIDGTFTATVVKDDVTTASGSLTISDADASDNPVAFLPVAATPGDNGYGNFALTGGTWTYTLDNAHAAVQAMNTGDTLTDTFTFTADDGSTRLVAVTINGAASTTGGVTDPVTPGGTGPTPDPDPAPEPEPLPEETPPVEEELSPPEEPTVAVPGPVKPSIISPTQQIIGNIFVPKIVLPITTAWIPHDNGPTADSAEAIIDYQRRELAPRETIAPVNETGTDFSADPIALTLNRIQQQFELSMANNAQEGRIAIGVATGLGVSVFAGYVIWAFRGASLLLGALSTLPMWRCFDPLPVLLRDDEQETRNDGVKRTAEADKDDDKVKAVLDSDRNTAGNPTLQRGEA